MNRHVTTEQLSAYLDRELGIAEMRQLDAHFNACSDCGARLVSMRRVVNGLGRVQRAAAPPVIAQQIRRQIATEAATPVPPLRRLLSLLSGLALQPHLRSSVAMALTLVLCVSLVGHGVGGGEARQQEEIFVVETYPGSPLSLPPTKSQVAGREFVWTEVGWVQRGLEGEQPGSQVDIHSAVGQALLTEYSDLEFLLADGSPVVLRYNLETVELRTAPNQGVRMLGFEPEPAYSVIDLRLLSA